MPAQGEISTPRPPIRTEVRAALERAWSSAIARGTLPQSPDDASRPEVEVERPANPEHGDFASNLAMRLARPYRMAPLAIAAALADELSLEATSDPAATPIARAEVAAPGFINLRLHDRALEDAVARVLADPAGWGRVAPIRPRAVNVEFVSANPTGPLHVGNARGAFIGDLLSQGPGGRRATRHARVLLQRFRWADPQPRRVRRRAPAGPANSRGRLQGRLRERPRRGAPG